MKNPKATSLTRSQAKRVALSAQGFQRPRPAGRVDIRHLRREILRMGLLQIDYINVLIPAQYQVLFSRLGHYDRRRLDELIYQRREFTEQWAHEASIIPVQHWPLLEYRRQTHRVRPWGFEKFLADHASYVDRTLGLVRERGPLTADELPEAPGDARRVGDEWGWTRGVRRQVLEAHFGSGRLAVANRLPNFQRVYDLAQRIIPPAHFGKSVSKADSQRQLLQQAARAHGVATAGDLADYYRMPVRETRHRLHDLEEDHKLSRVEVEGWTEPAYLHPAAQIPRQIQASTLLSPFDPLMWTRARVNRLFDFDYRIEIWVPRRKRRWGYYVLPFLLGEDLVARVDLKSDRKAEELLVLAAYLEPSQQTRRVAGPLARELRRWAEWLSLGAVRVSPRGDLAPSLAATLNSL